MQKAELQAILTAYRRELHRWPELSLQEAATSSRLKKFLRENGVTPLELPLPTGVAAEVRGALPGPVIALRADIDALPVTEQTGLEFASQNAGVMHACGHDVHMTALVGAAALLAQRRERLRGTVRLLFQPAEEAAHGAQWFAAQPGVLDNVQAIFGLHNKPDLPVGTIGVKNGPLMASVDHFIIRITGRGGHGGMPERCIDPIVAGSQLVADLQSLVSRRMSAFDNVVLSVTRFTAGNTWNVIPETAELEGTLRTFQQEARNLAVELLRRACEGAALASGAQVDFWLDEEAALRPLTNNAELAKLAAATARECGFTVTAAEPNPAGEDFSHYLERLPGCFVWLGSDGPYQWHDPRYIIDEGCLIVGAEFLAALAENVLAQWRQLRL